MTSRILIILLGVAMPLAAALAANGDPAPETAAFSLKGFGTLGATRSSSSEAEFVRDLSQPDGARDGKWTAEVDSLLGIQLNGRLSERIEAVAQVVSRYRYDASYRPELMWAFGKWSLSPELDLRVGRLGTDFFMLADSRLVGYSYAPVRPPGDYFGILPYSYFDGADAVAVFPLAEATLRTKLFAGLTREKVSLATRRWDLDASFIRGLHGELQIGDWTARAGMAAIRFKHNLPIEDLRDTLRPFSPAAADSLTVSDTNSRFYNAGVVYDSGPLQVQLMLNRVNHDSVLFENSRAGYLLAAYRVAQFTPFVGYSRMRSTPKQLSTGLPDVPFGALNSAVASVLADSHADQRTRSLGVRWDLAPKLDLKLQVDKIRGSPQSIFTWRGETSAWTGDTTVLSVTCDFIF